MRRFLLLFLGLIAATIATAGSISNNNSILYKDQIALIPLVGYHNLSGKFAPLATDANGVIQAVGADSATYQPAGTTQTIPSLAKVMIKGADGKPVVAAPIVGMYSDGTYKPIATDGLGRVILTAPENTGILNLNNLTAASQDFAVGTTGTDVNIVSAVGTHTFNFPDASATARGLITTGTQTIAGAKTFSTLPTLPLTSAHILLGSGSDIAADVAVSGEATIANTGAVTLSNAAVIGKVLTGYTAGAGTVAATDTILEAIQKLGPSAGHVAATVSTTNGLSISGQQVSLAAAGAAQNGAVTTGAQTFAGAKTFSGAVSFGAAQYEKAHIITSSPTTLDATYSNVLVNSASAFALNLPACASNEGLKYNIKTINTGTVTITPSGAEKIDGASSKALFTQYQALTLLCATSNWYVF